MGEEKIYLSRATRLFSRARFARELANVFKILCTGYSIFHSGSDVLGSIVHCSFEQGLIISWLENRERLIVEYLRFTLLLKCLRSELEVDGGKQF